MAIIMEKAQCNMQMGINMKANGLLEKNKAMECIIGLMETTMMAIGKKIQLKAQALHVLAVNFMMANFI